MVGTASLPHILTRFHTTPSVRETRNSVSWTLVFVVLLYVSAPALAALVKLDLLQHLVGAPFADLPQWIVPWRKVDPPVYEFDAEPTATVDEATARDATEDWTTTTRAVVEETTRAVEETVAETVEETIAETVEETIEAVVEAGRKPVSKMKKAELVALAESLGVDATGTVAALRGRLGPAVRGRAVAK